MIYDGFFDRYPNLKHHRRRTAAARCPTSIGAHGQVLRQHSRVPREDARAAERVHAPHLADAVVFAPEALEMCVNVFGTDNVLYGSDYPHTIGDMAGCLARVDALPPARATGARRQRACGSSRSNRACRTK